MRELAVFDGELAPHVALENVLFQLVLGESGHALHETSIESLFHLRVNSGASGLLQTLASRLSCFKTCFKTHTNKTCFKTH